MCLCRVGKVPTTVIVSISKLTVRILWNGFGNKKVNDMSNRERIEDYLNTLFDVLNSLQAEMLRTYEVAREHKGNNYDLTINWGKITESLISVQNKIVAVQHILDIID